MAFPSLGHGELAGFEAKAPPQFETEPLQMIQQRRLQVVLGINRQIRQPGKLEYIGIAQQVGDGLLGFLFSGPSHNRFFILG